MIKLTTQEGRDVYIQAKLVAYVVKVISTQIFFIGNENPLKVQQTPEYVREMIEAYDEQ